MTHFLDFTDSKQKNKEKILKKNLNAQDKLYAHGHAHPIIHFVIAGGNHQCEDKLANTLMVANGVSPKLPDLAAALIANDTHSP